MSHANTDGERAPSSEDPHPLAGFHGDPSHVVLSEGGCRSSESIAPVGDLHMTWDLRLTPSWAIDCLCCMHLAEEHCLTALHNPITFVDVCVRVLSKFEVFLLEWAHNQLLQVDIRCSHCYLSGSCFYSSLNKT